LIEILFLPLRTSRRKADASGSFSGENRPVEAAVKRVFQVGVRKDVHGLVLLVDFLEASVNSKISARMDTRRPADL